MRIRLYNILALLVLLLSVTQYGFAQNPANGDAIRVMATAFAHLQSEQKAAPVVVKFEMAGFDAPVELERAFAKAIGAAVASDIPVAEQKIVCTDPTAEAPHCRFNRFEAIVLTSRPVISGDKAKVAIHRFFAVGPETIVSEEVAYELVKVGGHWKVTDVVKGEVS